MDPQRAHLLRATLVGIAVSMIGFYVAYELLKPKKRGRKDNNAEGERTFNIFMSVLCLFFALYIPIPFILDSVYFDTNEVVSKVENVNWSKALYDSVILEKVTGHLRAFFSIPRLERGRTYRIIYAPRSYVILFAEEVEPDI